MESAGRGMGERLILIDRSNYNDNMHLEFGTAPELLDVVDENDNVIGQATREECHSRRLIHRCAFVLLYNSRGELLLLKRAAKVDRYPGLYSVVGEHVKAGESYEEAAKRGIKEELGADVYVERVAKIPMFSEEEREIGAIFKGVYDGPFRIDPGEVERITFHPLEEILEKLHRNEIQVTPGTSFILKYLDRRASI
jgi:isopentenyl-diphosphate delta-isomerase